MKSLANVSIDKTERSRAQDTSESVSRAPFSVTVIGCYGGVDDVATCLGTFHAIVIRRLCMLV
jgi:hypothetical protein